MKKSTLIILTILIIVVQGKVSFGQDTSAASYFAKLYTATLYRSGNGMPQDLTKAYNLFRECAEQGDMPQAMNELGLMYLDGKGTQKNYAKALHWFKKSAEYDIPFAYYNLGRMHKDGKGVKQNFNKAFEYFYTSAELDYPGGMYSVGYFLYKGLGCKQDYKQAVHWLKKGSEKEYAASMDLLAVCYQHGLGVEKDEEKALELFKKAADKGNKSAIKELEKRNKGNKLKSAAIRRKTQENNYSYNKITAHDSSIDLNGTWVGKCYYYEQSGEKILAETDLKITFSNTQNGLQGQLYINNNLETEFLAMVSAGQLFFSNAQFVYKNAFGEPVNLELEKARFVKSTELDQYISGNLDYWITDYNEPDRPCYILMKKETDLLQQQKDSVLTDRELAKLPAIVDKKIEHASKTNQPEEVFAENGSVNEAGNLKKTRTVLLEENLNDDFKVYPNPFKESLSVEYIVSVPSEVVISVFTLNGSLVYKKPLGFNQKGTYTNRFNFNEKPGIYILKLSANNQLYTQKISKK